LKKSDLALAAYKQALRWAAGNIAALFNLQSKLQELKDTADAKKVGEMIQSAIKSQRGGPGGMGGMMGGGGMVGGPGGAPINITPGSGSNPITINPGAGAGSNPITITPNSGGGSGPITITPGGAGVTTSPAPPATVAPPSSGLIPAPVSPPPGKATDTRANNILGIGATGAPITPPAGHGPALPTGGSPVH